MLIVLYLCDRMNVDRFELLATTGKNAKKQDFWDLSSIVSSSVILPCFILLFLYTNCSVAFYLLRLKTA